MTELLRFDFVLILITPSLLYWFWVAGKYLKEAQVQNPWLYGLCLAVAVFNDLTFSLTYRVEIELHYMFGIETYFITLGFQCIIFFVGLYLLERHLKRVK